MTSEDLNQLKIDRSAKVFRKSRGGKITYLVVGILLAILLFFLYQKGIIVPAIPVEVAMVSQIFPSQTLSQLNASGYVVAQRKAAVASKITGRLVALMVEEGSRVKEGQVIARLENEDAIAAKSQAEANVQAARANLEQARAELGEAGRHFERTRQLISKEYIARAEYDTAEARYLRARASVDAAQAALKASEAALQGASVTLEYALIRAPFDAVVLTKNADIGDIITPLGAAANAKAAVVTIADLSSLQVEVDVSETNLGLIKVGQPCEVQLDALPADRFRGTIHAIVPTVDRSKATILVKVRFQKKDPRILPEMRAKVAFLARPIQPEEQAPRTVLHPSALVSRGTHQAVFLVNGTHAVERAVRMGEPLGDLAEVLEGVQAGDRVVLRPPRGLKNGSKIKVAEK